MSTLTDRDGTALVIIDAQRGVFASTHDRDAVLDRIRDLVERARTAGSPVVWVQHNSDELPQGSEAWAFVDVLVPRDGEAVVQKEHADAFEATTLEPTLAELGVARLVVAGAQTDMCVRSTLHGAFARGYDVTLVRDAHSTEDLREWEPDLPSPAQTIAHTNTFWAAQSAPGRVADTASAASVDLT